MWKLYMCDTESRDVELATGNRAMISKPIIHLFRLEYPSWNREALVWPLGIWKRSLCGKRQWGRGVVHFQGSCSTEEDAFSMFLLSRKDPPSISSTNTTTFIHLCDPDQANPHQLQLCWVNRAALSMHCSLIWSFVAKLQLPRVCIIPLLRTCLSLFSSQCCFAPSILPRPCVAPCECWCCGVGVRICGRVSALIRPKRAHHFGTHTAHYFWLDVNSHRAEGWRRRSSWSLHYGFDRSLPTSEQQPL